MCSLRKEGRVRERGVRSAPVVNRPTELLIHAQNPISWVDPTNLPSLQSDSVMTISGETPVLCSLDKSNFEYFTVVDRTLS